MYIHTFSCSMVACLRVANKGTILSLSVVPSVDMYVRILSWWRSETPFWGCRHLIHECYTLHVSSINPRCELPHCLEATGVCEQYAKP